MAYPKRPDPVLCPRIPPGFQPGFLQFGFIQFAEAYEISPYAAPADQETLRRLFPSVRPRHTS